MAIFNNPRQTAGTATSSAPLARGFHTPVDATSGAKTMTLPTNAPIGGEISVEKVDPSANAVNVSGTLRGTTGSSIALTSQYDARTFLSEGNGSWRPISDHRTKTSLDSSYVGAVVLAGAGIDKTGATDSTAAMQAKINGAAAFGAAVYLPDGIYKVNGTLEIANDDTRMEFGPNAWLKPTTGVGLIVSANNRAQVIRPKIRIDGGNPTAGILVTTATRVTLDEPTVWKFSTTTGSVDGIVVDDNSYWCQVNRPRMRHETTAAGNLRRGVSVLNVSNAVLINGGDLAFCDVGVYLNEVDASLVLGTALESSTTGVEIAGAINGCPGTRVIGARFEDGVDCIKISSTIATLNSPLFFSGLTRVSNVTNLITNPNNIPYTLVSGPTIKLKGGFAGDGLTAQVEVTAGDQVQTADMLRTIGWGGTRNFAVDVSGNVILKSNNAAVPTHPDGSGQPIGFLRAYSDKLRLALWYSNATQGEVITCVGNGTGGLKDVLSVGSTYVRPSSDNVTSLGDSTHRFTTASIAGGVQRNLRTVTTSTTINGAGNTDGTLVTNGAALTITLPDPTSAGQASREYVVKNIHATAATVVSAGTAKTIDGAASDTLAQWESAQYVSDGTQWLVVDTDPGAQDQRVIVTAPTRTAFIAALDAAKAKGPGTIVYAPDYGTPYDLLNGVSLSGYSCQIQGAGAAGSLDTTPSGTVFTASTQTGPVLDFTGWVIPGPAFAGRVRHGGFHVRGSGVADPTKARSGIKFGTMSSATFHDISVSNTGGPCLEGASIPGNAVYLCTFERITLNTPVGAKTNDVAYMRFDEPNGTVFRNIGFRSMSTSADVGVSGAIVITSNAQFPTDMVEFDGAWFENLHVPTNGTLVALQAIHSKISGTQFFDCLKESGASGTSCFRLTAPTTTAAGANQIDGLIPGGVVGDPTWIDTGVDMRQSNNMVTGVKGFRGANVTFAAGVIDNHVYLGSGHSGAVAAAVVDNSGNSSNTVTDACLRVFASQPPWVPGVRKFIPGRYYGATDYGTPGTVANGAGIVTATPFWVQSPPASYSAGTSGILVSSISCEVTTAAAGATVRLGIYNSNSNDAPSTVLLDAGTVDASTTGIKEITGLSTVLPPGLYWLAAVAQGGAPALRTVGTSALAPVAADSLAASSTVGPNCYYATGITGALQSFSPGAGAASQGHKVMVKAG